MVETECDVCDETFWISEQKSKYKSFVCDDCEWSCTVCGEGIWGARRLKNKRQCYSCDKDRRERSAQHQRELGRKNRIIKNGHRQVTRDGYIRVTTLEGAILEHRFVVEQFLGRKLEIGENIHHKNGDRQDNRLSNLELWSTGQPAGQRVEDKVAYAIELLERYLPEAQLLQEWKKLI